MKKVKKLFKRIAKENKTTVNEVENEISLAILKAMENQKKSEEAELFWGELTKNNLAPTPEKVISAVAKKCLDFTHSESHR